MDDAEKPFVKKVAKMDKTDPKRLKKDLPKLVKSITGEDRVLFIGTSSKPWDGDPKLLYQTYDKVIYIPRPDYGTVSLIWKDLLYKVSYAKCLSPYFTNRCLKNCHHLLSIFIY